MLQLQKLKWLYITIRYWINKYNNYNKIYADVAKTEQGENPESVSIFTVEVYAILEVSSTNK